MDEQGECKKCVYLLIQKIVAPEVKDCIWRHIGQNLTNSGSEKSTDLSLLCHGSCKTCKRGMFPCSAFIEKEHYFVPEGVLQTLAFNN